MGELWGGCGVLGGILLLAILISPIANAQQGTKWVTAWAASSQGPYPSGSVLALPDQSFAFPVSAEGANDQSFRMIVRPSVLAGKTRLRFSNAFGTKSIKLDGVFVGLQLSSAAIVPRTNVPVLFSGGKNIVIAPGRDVWSDPVILPFAGPKKVMDLLGRKLAVSFHILGSSGPMTWHAKALQTSYISLPHAGSHGDEYGEQAFPTSSTAWFFLSAVDMRMPNDTSLVVCLGDSITDGTNSTLNGDDRWPDILQRRFSERRPNGVAVVGAGIGSNQITRPEVYDVRAPVPGGPAALQRIDRDVAALSGVTTVVWFEGINDLAHTVPTNTILDGYRTGVVQLRKSIPRVRVVGATITPALGGKNSIGSEEIDKKRKVVNDAIRSGDIFDAWLDFEQAVIDPQSGTLKPEYIPNSTIGGPGDNVHPNRAGYMAIGGSIDLDAILPKARSTSRYPKEH